MSTTTLITTTFVALALTLAAAPAAADPAGLELHMGLGIKTIEVEQCSSGSGWTCADSRTHAIVGLGPTGGIGYIKRTHRKRGWQFRFGPEVIASMVGDDQERGVALGAVMKAGFHFHWLSGEIGYGATTLAFKAGDFESRSAGLLIHYAGGIDFGSSRWGLRGKVDASISEGPVAVVAGLGLVYTP